MPAGYDKTQLGQLISAIWSKYLSLQGGNTEVQKQLLDKDKEVFHIEKHLFEKEKEAQELKLCLQEAKKNAPELQQEEKFLRFLKSGKIDNFIFKRDIFLKSNSLLKGVFSDFSSAVAFGLLVHDNEYIKLSSLGYQFFEWLILYEAEKSYEAK